MNIKSKVFKPLFKKNTDLMTLVFVFICAIFVFFSYKLLSTSINRWLGYKKKIHHIRKNTRKNMPRKSVSWRDQTPGATLEDVLYI